MALLHGAAYDGPKLKVRAEIEIPDAWDDSDDDKDDDAATTETVWPAKYFSTRHTMPSS